jgi:hypothetical protein
MKRSTIVLLSALGAVIVLVVAFVIFVGSVI